MMVTDRFSDQYVNVRFVLSIKQMNLLTNGCTRFAGGRGFLYIAALTGIVAWESALLLNPSKHSDPTAIPKSHDF